MTGDYLSAIFREDIVEQARRLSVEPRQNETPGGWQDRVRMAAIRAQPGIATPTPPIEGRDAGVERAIAEAISKADAAFGYSFNLTRLVDGDETHTLTMSGFEPLDFDDRDEGYALISERRNALRAATIRAALQALGERPPMQTDAEVAAIARTFPKCGPMDVCYCTRRCEGAGSGRLKPKYPSADNIVQSLRREGTSTHHVEDTIGFLGKEGYSYSQTGPINPDGGDAAWLIERLLLYVAHDLLCSANEMDPLDDTPCTCGLRDILRGNVTRVAQHLKQGNAK